MNRYTMSGPYELRPSAWEIRVRWCPIRPQLGSSHRKLARIQHDPESWQNREEGILTFMEMISEIQFDESDQGDHNSSLRLLAEIKTQMRVATYLHPVISEAAEKM